MTTPSISLNPPIYYQPNTNSILNTKNQTLATRIFFTILPFIALHKPFGRMITLLTDSTRTIHSLAQLLDKQDRKASLKTVIAVAALAGTVFMHPLGLCIATLYDLISNLPEVLTQIQTGEFLALISTVQQGFYLGTILTNSLGILVISLLLSTAIEMYRSSKEYQSEHLVECAGHFLMSIVRFNQSIPHMAKSAEKQNLSCKQQLKILEKASAKIRDRSALFFYSSARCFATPLWKNTSLWLQTISECQNPLLSRSEKISSIAISSFFSLALLPLTLSSLVVGQAFHFTAFNLATTPYIHLKGSVEPKTPENTTFSLFQLNCCLTAGDFARLFGGMEISDQQRVEKIAKIIKEQNPDIASLQEVSDLESALSLYHKLSSEFSEFYLNIGTTPFILQNNSGLFVASKWAISNPEFHSFSDIEGTETMVNKGYFTFSTSVAHFINTHLSPSSIDLLPTKEEHQIRKEEQLRILNRAEEYSSEHAKPIFISGDYNTNMGPLFDKATYCSEATPQGFSETEYLINRNWNHNTSAQPNGQALDYFLSFFQYLKITTKVIPTFNTDLPQNAISDHPALYSEIDLS